MVYMYESTVDILVATRTGFILRSCYLLEKFGGSGRAAFDARVTGYVTISATTYYE